MGEPLASMLASALASALVFDISTPFRYLYLELPAEPVNDIHHEDPVLGRQAFNHPQDDLSLIVGA
jgi:hypothetical protein